MPKIPGFLRKGIFNPLNRRRIPTTTIRAENREIRYVTLNDQTVGKERRKSARKKLIKREKKRYGQL